MTVGRILVLDVGTSALKAVLFDAAGAILAVAEAGYGAPPAPYRQDVEAWWRAARTAVAALGARSVDAIALAGTMENLIPVDGGGRPVCEAILYGDPCGADACERLADRLAGLSAAGILGNPPEPLMTAFKLAWLAEHRPEAWAAAAWYLPGAKDAVAFRLTGRAATDPVTATTTGLMDLEARAWSPPLVAAFGVPPDRLPPILPADAVIGTLAAEAAADLGLEPAAVPVVNGCGDGGATTLGAACLDPGDLSLHVGTTGWLARVVDGGASIPDATVYRLAHPEAGRLIEITPMLSAGAAAAWARALLGLSEAAAEAALAKADAAPPEIVFLPYLAGERFPFLDPDVRGAFHGLDARHGAAELYYAVLEGVAHALRANLAVLDPDGIRPLRLAGGGAQSLVWRQMLADVVGRPMAVPDAAVHVTALGAFRLAAKALGLAADPAVSPVAVVPRPERRQRADRLGRAFARATAAARERARPVDPGAPASD